MKHAEQKILEMVISRYHARKILKIGRKLLELDAVIRLDVVPTPHELIKCLFLALPVCQHLRMPPRIVDLAQLLKSDLLAGYLLHPLVCIDDRFITIFVQFSTKVVQEQFIRNLPLTSVCLDQIGKLLLIEEDLSTLETPPEISLIEHALTIGIQTPENFMQKSHPIHSALSQQMTHLLFESELIDHLIFYLRLIELLLSRCRTQNQP